MSRNLLVRTKGGGIFSTFIIAIQSILKQVNDLENINNIYIEFDKNIDNPRHYFHLDNNVYNFVFDQSNDNINSIIQGEVYPDHIYPNLAKIDEDVLNKMKFIVSKLKLKPAVTTKINPKIDKNTLGVHVRVTDMRAGHPEYFLNERTKDTYISKIEEIVSENANINKIFIASDNDDLLSELKKYFPNLISNDVSNRWHTKDDIIFPPGYTEYQYQQMANEQFWIDSFVEMYSLSKCGYLLYSTSNLSHSSLFFSDTISKIYKL